MKNIKRAIITSRRRCEWYMSNPVITKEECKDEQVKTTR
jgi:hypothetical protein